MECDEASCRDAACQIGENCHCVGIERGRQNRRCCIHQCIRHRNGSADGADVGGIVLTVSVVVWGENGPVVGDGPWRGKGVIGMDVAERKSELQGQREERQYRQPFCV